MKKKILLVTLSCLLLFSGVVNAANIWGTYKGNQIIRLTVNGDPVKVSDVPAISYNGRTMIPIYLLQQAGINYSWDQFNQTVNITGNKESNYNQIKTYVQKADTFQKLKALGELIAGLSDGYSLAYQGIQLDSNPSENFIKMNKELNDAINYYNDWVNKLGSDPLYSNILSSYYKSLDYYKIVDSELNDFYLNRDNASFVSYLNNSDLGFKSAGEGRINAMNQYTFYINLALNN
ncbi:hypothetical protein D3C76_449170 [compost metagenome]